MSFHRRGFLQTAAGAALAGCARIPATAPPPAGPADHTIRIWDIDSGKEPKILTGHTGWVQTLV